MNNANNEDTAALFVSSQKKKQAEEEARRKAEAEQAKRDAAEAEVRRMEAEVEERKRKAEEERRALEEAARAAEAEKANVAEKLKASVNVDDIKSNVEEIKSKVKEKTEGKSKLPIFIGAGAAAVVIIVLILVFALKGKGGKIDFETLEYAKEYTVADPDHSLVLTYPESLYPELSESKVDEDNSVHVSFETANKKTPKMDVFVSDSIEGEYTGLISAAGQQGQLESYVKNSIGSLKISEETKTDISAETPGKYFYDCTATSDEGDTYVITSWIENDSNGNQHNILGVFHGAGSDPANAIKLRDLFEEKNSGDAIKVPGGNPPASVETDGMLEVDAMHMGIIVPKDQFKKAAGDEEMGLWSDNNGAVYAIAFMEVGFDFDAAHEHAAEVQEMMKPIIESIAGLKGNPDLESRMLLNDSWPSDLKYFGEYKDIIGGITYWEGNYSSMWRDVRTNKYYLYDLAILAPSANEDVYKGLFEKGIDRLQDI